MGQQDYGRHFRRRIVPLLCFIVFFSVLNGTMFNVAIPDIAAQFALSPAGVSWVITIYIVVFALASVTYGKLADLHPVRILITIGLLLFNTGALLGFFAQWYPLLIVARLIQASGGGAIPALGMLVATRYVPPESRGMVLGAIASTVAFGAGIGPVVGGFLAGKLHWNYLFLLSNVTLVAIPLFWRLLPQKEKTDGHFDRRGAALLASTVVLALLFVAQGALWALPAGVLTLLAFTTHIRRSAHPFVPAALFAHRHYSSGLITAFLAVGTVFGKFFLVPLLLRDVHHLGTWHIGLVLFPGAMSAAVLGTFGGRLADRIGSPTVVRMGLCLVMAGFFLLAAFAGRHPHVIALVLIVSYVGFSFIHASLAKTVSLALPHAQTGVGMGFYNLIFFTSGAFGSALAGQLLELAPKFLPGSGPADPFRLAFLVAALTDLAALAFFHHRFKKVSG